MSEDYNTSQKSNRGSVLIRCKVTPYMSDIRGGAGKLMMNLSMALAESGWDVTIISPKPHSSDDISRPQHKNLHYEEFNYRNPTNLAKRVIGSIRGKQEFSSIVEKKDIDIIIDDVSHLPFYPAHFRIPSSIKNAVFIHTALFDAAWGSAKFFKAPIVEFVDRTLPYLNRPEIICAGPSTETRIQKYLRYRHTHIIRPYADIEEYNYKFDPTAKQILYLGRLTKRKNLRCLLDAWKIIERQYPEYNLTIAGDGELRARLMEYKDDIGLDNVDFPGFVSEERKKKLFEESLLFATPSLEEGYLTSGLEALAAGTPVVGTDTHGINDYIENGKNGVLFERDDSQDLANKLSSLLADPQQIEELARNGEKTANKHSYNKFRQSADDVLMEIL